MIVHEPMDIVHSTNSLLYYSSSPKTSEDAHEFIMALQDLLLDELNHSEEMFDNDLYLSMRGFWELFIGEITHKYTCTLCDKIL